MTDGKGTRRGFLKGTGVAMAGFVGGSTSASGYATASPEATARRIFDVREFGAKGDGKTLDTPSINKAIEAAAAAGGGTVYFGAGSYLSYSIRLKSKIALTLAAGSTIVAADPPTEKGAEGNDPPESNKPWEDYQDFGHNHWHNSL